MLVGRTVYGESRPNPEASNLRGKVVQLFDQAGVVTSDATTSRAICCAASASLPKTTRPRSTGPAAVPLEAETYTSRTRYDALNRPIQVDRAAQRPARRHGQRHRADLQRSQPARAGPRLAQPGCRASRLARSQHGGPARGHQHRLQRQGPAGADRVRQRREHDLRATIHRPSA